MKKLLAILMTTALSVWAGSTYYEWSGSAFATDTNGTGRAVDADPDGDQIRNAEEYAFLTDPLSANVSPATIGVSNGTVYIGFPWNNGAVDLEWKMEQASALGSNDWNTVTNLNVESTPNGNLDDLRVQPLDNLGGSGFFRLKAELAEPELILDALEGGAGWLTFNQAEFVTSSGELLPEVGVEFFKHSVGANWSHSGFFKPTNLILQGGHYFVTLWVGHDGSPRPFADGNITLGFFDSATPVGKAVDIRDAVNAFSALPGVSRVDELATPVPSNGWEEWRIEYIVDPGSSAIGQRVNVGLHAQSRADGGNQAMFDGLSISTSEMDSIRVHVEDVVRTNLPSTLFNGHLVHHKASIKNMIWDHRTTGNTLRQGYTEQAFDELHLHGVRYPGGTAAKTWYDYDDQGGVAWLADNGVTNTGTGTLDTIGDVVDWCRDASLTSYFIVPVVRFWDGNQYGAASNYASHAVSLTQSIAAGHNGPMPEYWDIGNEIYEPDYDSATYAQFAGPIAQAIKAVDSNLKPVVCVKRGNPSAAREIADTLQLNSNSWDAVSGVTFHALNVGITVWGGNTLYLQAMEVQALFPGKEFLVTALAPSPYNGLECANAILGSYEQLIRAGAGHIVNWPATHFNTSGRLWIEGLGLTPSGKVLRWLGESGIGNPMLSVTENTAHAVKVLAFKEANGQVTAYIAGMESDLGTEIKLSVGGFQGSDIRAVRLKASGADTRSDVFSEEPVSVSGSNPYVFVLNKNTTYEIIKLEILP